MVCFSSAQWLCHKVLLPAALLDYNIALQSLSVCLGLDQATTFLAAELINRL